MLASKNVRPYLSFRIAVPILILFSLTGHSQASVVVVDRCDVYDMINDALDIGSESLDFSTYDGAYASLDVACSIGLVGLSSSSGLQGVLGSYLKTDSIGATLVIDFEQEVRSVGGFFFLVDQFELPVMGILELELSDGSSYVTSLNKDGGFSGFISSSADIESLTLRGFGPSVFAAPAVSSLKLGVVPSPAGLFVMGVAGISRRRRKVRFVTNGYLA